MSLTHKETPKGTWSAVRCCRGKDNSVVDSTTGKPCSLSLYNAKIAQLYNLPIATPSVSNRRYCSNLYSF
uniref:Uncharacterized protein n=1 Tax=Steinernema glaseri TaxID=37863 RepID=A0A1I8A881_9BILA